MFIINPSSSASHELRENSSSYRTSIVTGRQTKTEKQRRRGGWKGTEGRREEEVGEQGGKEMRKRGGSKRGCKVEKRGLGE